MNYEIGPYDPCPCGSGEKYKFCCAAKAKGNQHGKFPVGTVAFYGPDDKTSTKIVAGVVLANQTDPILERFVGTNIVGDSRITEQIKRFFAKHGVKHVVITDGNLGCVHEEGIDYPSGQNCPYCPFWAGKQGSTRREDGHEVPAVKDADSEADEAAVDDLDDDEADSDWEDEDDRDFDAIFERVQATTR